MQVSLTVNGASRTVEVDDDTPLLWVLRENFGLVGTKFGCGIGACGACTVHVNGAATRSCSVPASQLVGKAITTIEGLGSNGQPHPVQAEWVRAQVPQCGYCQSGMIMAVAALLESTPEPTPEQVGQEITNVCRCGTYDGVRAAIAFVSIQESVRRKAKARAEGASGG